MLTKRSSEVGWTKGTLTYLSCHNTQDCYLQKVFAMTDKELFEETKSSCWLSVFHKKNLRNQLQEHWQLGACKEAWIARNEIEQFDNARQEVLGFCGY